MCQDMTKISVENFPSVEEIYERDLFFKEFDIPEAECVGESVERSIGRFHTTVNDRGSTIISFIGTILGLFKVVVENGFLESKVSLNFRKYLKVKF